jgi:hypothetical protein
VKRSRSVKEVLRNTKENVTDLILLIACGLHNLRVRYRKRRLKLLDKNLFQIKSIEAALTQWTTVLGVGPVFSVERARIADFQYHGQPSAAAS